MVPAAKSIQGTFFLYWPLPGNHDMIPLLGQKVSLRYVVKSVVNKENFIERLLYTGFNHDYPVGLENCFD
jgi:hypothetical protein